MPEKALQKELAVKFAWFDIWLLKLIGEGPSSRIFFEGNADIVVLVDYIPLFVVLVHIDVSNNSSIVVLPELSFISGVLSIV